MNYPERESFFAHRFCRLLAKTCAAQRVGPDGCWLLSIIAQLEDSKRYTDAVDFYNRQLMPIAGFTREHTFIAARQRCIDHGWLHYEKGGRKSPGRYWVTVPNRFAELPDGPCDESVAALTDKSVRQTSSLTDENVSQSEDCLTGSLTNSSAIPSVKAEEKRQRYRQSSLPSPSPSPNTPANAFAETQNADCGNGIPPNRKSKRHAYTDDFKRFWEVCPKKVDKQDAAKAFTRAVHFLLSDDDHPEILTESEAVEFLVSHMFAYAREVRGHEPRYIKHPASWLSKGGYDDEADTTTSTAAAKGQPFFTPSQTTES